METNFYVLATACLLLANKSLRARVSSARPRRREELLRAAYGVQFRGRAVEKGTAEVLKWEGKLAAAELEIMVALGFDVHLSDPFDGLDLQRKQQVNHSGWGTLWIARGVLRKLVYTLPCGCSRSRFPGSRAYVHHKAVAVDYVVQRLVRQGACTSAAPPTGTSTCVWVRVHVRACAIWARLSRTLPYDTSTQHDNGLRVGVDMGHGRQHHVSRPSWASPWVPCAPPYFCFRR